MSDSYSDDDNSSAMAEPTGDASGDESVETTVSDGEMTRRLKHRIEMLSAELKKERKKALNAQKKLEKPTENKIPKRKSTSSSEIVTQQISLSLAPKPKVFDVNSNGNISASKLHNHLTTIQAQLGTGALLSRDALSQLFTAQAQSLIVQSYEQWIMTLDDDDKNDETDPFKLPTAEFIERMFDLFPLSHQTSSLQIIRDSAQYFEPTWFKHGSRSTTPKMHAFCSKLFGTKLNLFRNAQYASGNGDVCTADEFPQLLARSNLRDSHRCCIPTNHYQLKIQPTLRNLNSIKPIRTW